MSDSQPDRIVRLFIDRDAWSGKLDAALRLANIPFEAHRTHFPHDTPDTEWLAKVGQAGWVVVTRDQNIRRKPNELAALRDAKVVLFALTSGNLSAQDTAEIIVSVWPKIKALVSGTRPPAIFSVSRAGEIRRIER